MTVYLELFSDWSDVQREYQMGEPEPDQVLLAYYTYEDYDGESVVAYRSGDRYYMNVGSHCSCMGLEGQWAPESYGRDELVVYLEHVTKLGYGVMKALAPSFLKNLEEMETDMDIDMDMKISSIDDTDEGTVRLTLIQVDGREGRAKIVLEPKTATGIAKLLTKRASEAQETANVLKKKALLELRKDREELERKIEELTRAIDS